MADGEVHVDVRPEIDDGSMRRATSTLETEFNQSSQRVGTDFKSMLTTIAGAFAAKETIGAIFSIGSEYRSAMNELGAVSGATDQQMQTLRKTAKDLGNDISLPGASAKDAALAMVELTKGGMSVDQTLASVKGTMQLAAAAGISQAQAAEIQANALNAFHLPAEKAGRVADLLANAANASSIEITDASQSFQAASAVFAAFQGPVVGNEQAMKDLTTAIALMGNAGIKGSDAGTSLKAMMLSLSGPTGKTRELMVTLAESIGMSGNLAYDASGRMRPMNEMLGILAKSTANMSQEQRDAVITQIFGADASRAVITLLRAQGGATDAMSASLDKQGSAAALAAAKNKGFAGALDGLKSQLETLAINIYERAEPALTAIATALSSAFTWLTEHGDIVMAVLAGIATAMIVGLTPAVWAMTTAWIAETAAMIAANAPIIAVAATLAALVGGVVWAYQNVEWFRDLVQTAWEAIKTATSAAWTSVIQPTLGFITDAAKALGDFFTTSVVPALQTAWTVIGDVARIAWESVLQPTIAFIVDAAGALFAFFRDSVVPALQTAWGVIGDVAKAAWESVLRPTFGFIVDAARALGDFFTNTVAPVMSAAWDVMKTAISVAWDPGIKSVIDAFKTLSEALQVAWSTVIGPALGVAWDVMKAAIGVAWAVIKANIDLFKSLGEALQVAWSTVIGPALSAAWGAVRSGVDVAWAAISAVIDLFQKAGEGLQTAWEKVIGPAISAAWDGIKSALQAGWPVMQGILKLLETAFGAVRDSVGWVWDRVNDLIDLIKKIPTAISIAIHWVVDALPDVGGLVGKLNPFNADGGYFDRPTAGIFGEAGPEVILPLTRPNRLRELLAMPEVRPAVLAALGGSAVSAVDRAPVAGISTAAAGGSSRSLTVNNYGLAGVTLDERELVRVLDRAERMAGFVG